MDYLIHFTIPANTPESDPAEHELSLPAGVIKRVSIYFPWGPAGMVHVAIYHDETQVWPSLPEYSYVGNMVLIDFPEDYVLADPKNRFVIRGWSPGTDYDHTPLVHLVVLPERIPAWLRPIYNKLLGRRG